MRNAYLLSSEIFLVFLLPAHHIKAFFLTVTAVLTFGADRYRYFNSGRYASASDRGSISKHLPWRSFPGLL